MIVRHGKQAKRQRLIVLGDNAQPISLGKAAVLAKSIIRRHPFVDGNKRTAAMYMVAYLLERLGYKLEAEQKNLEDFVVRIVRRAFEPEDMTLWFEDHSRKS